MTIKRKKKIKVWRFIYMRSWDKLFSDDVKSEPQVDKDYKKYKVIVEEV